MNMYKMVAFFIYASKKNQQRWVHAFSLQFNIE